MAVNGPVPAVLAVVHHQGQVLLVRRGQPPNKGRWGFPGGKIEPGETMAAAAERELFEETGIRARASRILTALDAIGNGPSGAGPGYHFVLIAVACEWLSGTAQAASDAADVRWVGVDDLNTSGLDLIERVTEVARLANALPG